MKPRANSRLLRLALSVNKQTNKHTHTQTHTAVVGVGRLSGDAPATYLNLPNEDTQVNTVTDTNTLASYGRRIYLLYITETLFGYVITVNKSGRVILQANRPFEVWPGAHSTGNTGDR